MSEKHLNMVVRAKISLMKNPKASWLMSMLLGCSTKITNVTPCGVHIPTLAVDSSNLYINPEYFESLEPNLRESALLHESLHLALKHVFRYVDFPNTNKFNLACDHIVNYMLQRLGFSIHPNWIYDSKYDNWSITDIYNDISDDTDQESNCMFKPITPDQVQELQARIYAAETILSKNPSLMQSIKGVLDAFVAANSNPLPFKEILSEYLNEINRDDRSWQRPNRRMFAANQLAKGYSIGSLRSAVVAFDCSGSMSEQQRNVCIEQIEFMRDVLNISEIHLIVFDDQINNVIKIPQYTPISQFELNGGNGTNLTPVLDYIEDNQISPEVLLIFTDMGLYLPEKRPNYSVVWIGIEPSQYWVERLTTDPNFFGKYAELKF